MFSKKSIVLISLISILSSALAAALPAKKDSLSNSSNDRVLYDQRQEGEWNVRADLKNFVILVIPTISQVPSNPTTSSSSSSTGSLLDFLTKSVPYRSHFKQNKNGRPHIKDNELVQQETAHFIESKTAPYHVDISQSNSAQIREGSDGILNENQPNLKPIQLGIGKRFSRAFLLTMPNDEDFVLTKMEDHKKIVKKDVKKKPIKAEVKNEFKLLGAEHEQCGPGMARDSYGNCTPAYI